MPSTHTSLHYLVFSTKNREAWFTGEIRAWNTTSDISGDVRFSRPSRAPIVCHLNPVVPLAGSRSTTGYQLPSLPARRGGV